MDILMTLHAEQIKNNIKSLEKSLTTLVHQNKRLSEENQHLKEDAYKDDELIAMQVRLKEAETQLKLGFGITVQERQQIQLWQTEHLEKEHNNRQYFGAIGGNFNYVFIPTSIGVVGYCRCGGCYNAALRQEQVTQETLNQYMIEHDAEYTFQDI